MVFTESTKPKFHLSAGEPSWIRTSDLLI